MTPTFFDENLKITAPLKVVLDAAVLFPAGLRDTLLRYAQANLFQAYWSRQILEEVRRNLVQSAQTTEIKAQRLINLLIAAFPEAIISPRKYSDLIEKLDNDPNDRHVLAAAIAVGAEVIVTTNIRHFPSTTLAPYHLIAQTPDIFIRRLFVSNPNLIATIIAEQAKDLKHPPKTVEDVLGMLALHAPITAKELENYMRDKKLLLE